MNYFNVGLGKLIRTHQRGACELLVNVGLLLTIERTLFILLRLVNELLQRGAYYIFVSTNVGLCALLFY